MTKKSESKPVEATGTAAAGSNGLTPGLIQDAMAQAAADAQAERITDQDEIRERMLAARKAAKGQP